MTEGPIEAELRERRVALQRRQQQVRPQTAAKEGERGEAARQMRKLREHTEVTVLEHKSGEAVERLQHRLQFTLAEVSEENGEVAQLHAARHMRQQRRQINGRLQVVFVIDLLLCLQIGEAQQQRIAVDEKLRAV